MSSSDSCPTLDATPEECKSPGWVICHSPRPSYAKWLAGDVILSLVQTRIPHHGVIVMAMHRQEQLIGFLRNEIGLPTEAIQLALSHPEHALGMLPMILWQYGLVTLPQLDQIFDWMENGYA